ncbi:MAG: DinB family protein [Dehalococcoidia bacterium]
MTRAQDLIAPLIRANYEFIKVVEALTDEQWRLKTVDEGWPVCVVARHIAIRCGIEEVEWILSGHLTPFWANMDELDAANAQHARDFANCSKEEALDRLRDVSSRVEDVLGALTDEQLEIRAQFVGRGPATVEQWIRVMMPNHVELHQASILRTISQNSAP